jgi:NAD(P)-dependent dehydrogenase (short-subunit alcohol dehydrogenase family)
MFEGHVVLITGAASGIGRESARLFLEEGAIVIGADLDQASLAEARAALGGRFFPRACDVTREDQVAALAGFVGETQGKLDTLVNNAGPGRLVALETMQEADSTSTIRST